MQLPLWHLPLWHLCTWGACTLGTCTWGTCTERTWRTKRTQRTWTKAPPLEEVLEKVMVLDGFKVGIADNPPLRERGELRQWQLEMLAGMDGVAA